MIQQDFVAETIAESTSPSAFGKPAAPVHSRLAGTERRFVFILGLLGALLVASIVFYGFVWPQTPGRLERASVGLYERVPLWEAAENLASPKLADAAAVAALLLLFATLSFAAYAAALLVAWNRPAGHASLYVAGAGALIFFYVSAWSLPNVSTDIFNYIARGRLAAVHQANPYYVAVDEFRHDPIYPYAGHRYTANPGEKFPTFMILNFCLAKIAGDDPVTNLFVYRFAFLAFNLATVALIGVVAHRLNPSHTLSAMIAYGWNPIVFLHGQYKTDTLMAFWLVLSVLFFVTSRPKLGAVALGLSIWIKLITLPLALAYFVQRLKWRRYREAASTAALIGAVTVAVYLPFAESPWLPLEHLLKMERGGASSASWLKPILMLGFLLLIPSVALRTGRSDRELLRGWAIILLYFSAFLTNFALSWYLMTFLAISALTFEWRIVAPAVLLSFSAFVLNTWGATSTPAFALPFSVSAHRHLVYLLPVLAAGAAFTAGFLWRRRGKAASSER